jgi:hypothetical protein
VPLAPADGSGCGHAWGCGDAKASAGAGAGARLLLLLLEAAVAGREALLRPPCSNLGVSVPLSTQQRHS